MAGAHLPHQDTIGVYFIDERAAVPANELGAVVAQRNRDVIRTSINGFHRPRAERYARGRYSPEGYYFDARDLGAIRGLLLDPLGPGGGRQYSTASFDLERDATIEQAPLTASANSVLVVDGTFLQRPELVDGWDVTVFLDASEAVSERRGVRRDAERLGALPRVHDGASGAVWAASGRSEQVVAPVSEVENLTAISNFWALTGRFLIGKSWKIIDIARLWPRPATAAS